MKGLAPAMLRREGEELGREVGVSFISCIREALEEENARYLFCIGKQEAFKHFFQ